MRYKLIELLEEIDESTTIVEYFNIPLSDFNTTVSEMDTYRRQTVIRTCVN